MFTNKIRAVLIAAFMVGGAFAMAPEASAGGWGWAKPYNQRLGAFYTSNRARYKNKSNTTRSSSSRYRTWSNGYRSSRSSSSSNDFFSNPTYFRPSRVIPFNGTPDPYGFGW